MDVTTKRKREWIAEGEKFALIALSMGLAVPQKLEQLSPNYFVFGKKRFDLPKHWRDWLGSIHSEWVDNADLFLMTKMVSLTPDILDGESNELIRNVRRFYTGLILSTHCVSSHPAIQLTGGFVNNELTVRQQAEFPALIVHDFSFRHDVSRGDLIHAARIGTCMEKFDETSFDNGRSRLSRIVHVYADARSQRYRMDRLHQFARSIDGLILSQPGSGKSQFKSRTALFMGPNWSDFMGEAYVMRSEVEHLHEYRRIEVFDRQKRLEIMKTTAVLEFVARKSISRILSSQHLCGHFANTTALKNFWELDEADRQRLWGEPFDVNEALTDFHPQNYSDQFLA